MMFGGFRVVGDDLDPDEVTELTGLDPSDAWRKGDPHVNRIGVVLAPRKTSVWSFYAPTEFSLDLPELLDGLLDRFEPKRDENVALLHRTSSTAEVSLHIYMSDQTPIGTISLATLKRIVALNADLDLDLYVVDDDRLKRGSFRNADWNGRR